MSPSHLQIVSESEKTENVSTNEVKPDFKLGMKNAEPGKKYEISCNNNIDNTIDETFRVIRNASNPIQR